MRAAPAGPLGPGRAAHYSDPASMRADGIADETDVMRVGRRCFISNLAWRTSWQDLKDAFRDCGTVVYANVIRDESGEPPPPPPRDLSLPAAHLRLRADLAAPPRSRAVQGAPRAGASWSLRPPRR
jgi:hypothetical protein